MWGDKVFSHPLSHLRKSETISPGGGGEAENCMALDDPRHYQARRLEGIFWKTAGLRRGAKPLKGRNTAVQDDESLACYIEANPYYPTPDEARVKEYGVSVWAIIAHLRAVGGDAARVAEDYALPKEAVEAAIAYYHRHKDLIDARIVANAT